MKKALKLIITIIVLSISVLLITDKTYLLKALRTTYLRGQTDVGIYDFRVQATNTVKATPGNKWELHEKYNQVELSESILSTHDELKTTAFIVIQGGKIVSEHYFNEGGKDVMTGVWSVTKTYTSLLALKAQQDGLIDDINDPVKKYLPKWDIEQEETLTLRHLASMSTGLFWNEWNHTPLSLIAKLNFYSDLEKFTYKDMYSIGAPGEIQHYNSGATQVMGTVLNAVLEDQSISDYLSEKFWQPLGCQHDALFIVDSKKNKNEKTYGGLVATARDISRLGQVIVDDGKWNNIEILTKEQLELVKSLPYKNDTYGYGIWTDLYEGERFYYQAGFKGQLCISFPKHDLVITRFGHKSLERPDMEDISPDVIIYIKEALRIVEKANEESASID